VDTVVTGTREEINSKWVNIRVSTLKSTNVERNNERLASREAQWEMWMRVLCVPVLFEFVDIVATQE
jgi:hypothetical protein